MAHSLLSIGSDPAKSGFLALILLPSLSNFPFLACGKSPDLPD